MNGRSGWTEVSGLKFPVRTYLNTHCHTSGIAKTCANPLQIPPMSTVADQLRDAREARNLTINQVADATKIRTDHIRALEEGNYNVFSAPVYIRGFVRVYATLLKLDGAQVMTALDAELSETEKFREPPPLTDRPKGILDFVTLQLSKVDWKKGVVALIILVIIGVVVTVASIWIHYRNTDPLAELPPAVYQPAQPSSSEVLPLPSPSSQK